MTLKKIFPLASLTAPVVLSCCSPEIPKDDRPNIIVILADDMGYSDLGCYGGEIETPNLDRLAQNGLRFTQFYNAGRSCPSRAALLTGLYPHQAGVGLMTFDQRLPGYRGNLSHNSVTIAEALKTVGYQTCMIGKWHVAETQLRSDQRQWISHQVEYDEFTHRDNYPTQRGFDYCYGTIYGVINYFDPFSLVYGDKPVRSVPDDYYSTIASGDSAVACVDRYARTDHPFFMYLAFHAPHWPLQALPEDIKKYEDIYKVGWEAIRNRRYARMRVSGLFGDRQDFLSERRFNDAWDDNPDSAWDARAMAVHAAMVDRMDQEVGKLIRALEKNGQLDNTLILFLVDNGCAAEECQFYDGGSNDLPADLRNGQPVIFPQKKETMPGPANVNASIGPKWANVANTPFRLWKATMYEGGICTPAIAHWPKGITRKDGYTGELGNTVEKGDAGKNGETRVRGGSITDERCHVIDIMATCLELSGATYPASYNGNDIIPLSGISFASLFKTGQRDHRHDHIGFEHYREKAFMTGDGWKIVQRQHHSEWDWELYDLKTDRTEMHDVAALYPEKVKELVIKFKEWAEQTAVIPSPEPLWGGPVDEF